MVHKKFILAGLCAALLMVVLFTGNINAGAASSSEIRDQINSLEQSQKELAEQMEKLEAQLSENAEQLQQMILHKQTIDQQINLLHTQIRNADEQISAYSLLIADKQLELEKAEHNLAQLNLIHKDRIRAMEEAGDLSYWTILFEARSITDLLDRLNTVRDIASADRRRLEEIRTAAQLVKDAKEELASEKTALEQVRKELENTQLLLQSKSKDSEKLVLDLLEKGEEYETLLDQAERDDEQLMQDIAKLEDDFEDAVYQEWLATYVPPTTAPEKEEYPTVGDSGWLTPVTNYRLTSPFGMRKHPILGIYRMHSGVDMACPEGTPIYATRGGKVTIAKYSSSAGNYVQINHGDGYASVYMHMTQYVVHAGEFVAQGQLIGYVGNTGLSKGNHLHFGISYHGEYVNPMEFIG